MKAEDKFKLMHISAGNTMQSTMGAGIERSCRLTNGAKLPKQQTVSCRDVSASILMCHLSDPGWLPLLLETLCTRSICTVLNISCTAGGQVFRSGKFSTKRLRTSAASEGGHGNGSHPSGMAEGRTGQEEV